MYRHRKHLGLYFLNCKEKIMSRLFSSELNVSDRLRQKEMYKKYDKGRVISHLYANQVGAHSPIQETWAEASTLHNNDMMFGVFDGNSGSACSHVVAKRIFKYLQASMLPKNLLAEYIKSLERRDQKMEILKSFQDKYFFLEAYQKVYDESFMKYLRELAVQPPTNVEEAMRGAFERLDADLSKEAMEDSTSKKIFLWVGMTGSGATILHLSGTKATIATTGDSMVVVGTKEGECKVLSPEHNTENEEEVKRVEKEHPLEEGLVKNGHLLGVLTSFRSFGNFRYKWDKDTIERVLIPNYGKKALPKMSITPPYLTATPQINNYIISPEDRFIIIASDGIWDIFPPKKVVEIIKWHKPISKQRKMLLIPVIKFKQILSIMRKQKIKKEKDVMESPATQVILEGLVTSTKLVHLPEDLVRNVRDDMTVLVLYVNTEYARVNAQEKKVINQESK